MRTLCSKGFREGVRITPDSILPTLASSSSPLKRCMQSSRHQDWRRLISPRRSRSDRIVFGLETLGRGALKVESQRSPILKGDFT